MQLPKWVIAWLESAGIAAEDFEAVLEAAAQKLDAPQELQDAIALWIQEHVKKQLSPEVILSFAALIVAELKSGHPGYNPEHGGLI